LALGPPPRRGSMLRFHRPARMVPKSAAALLVLGDPELMKLLVEVVQLPAQLAPLVGLELLLPGRLGPGAYLALWADDSTLKPNVG
jgi:hypothetical protein